MQQAERRLRVIRLILIWQLVGAVVVGLAGFFWNRDVALAAFLGGLTVVLPNSYFAYRAFRYRVARAARLIVRSFYAGAAGKMLLTAGMFTLVFINLNPLNAPAVFIGFALVQTLSWVVPLVISRQEAAEVSLSVSEK
ncbi:ATP synthase subunit I [Granulosicoccus sp. 3-233]